MKVNKLNESTFEKLENTTTVVNPVMGDAIKSHKLKKDEFEKILKERGYGEPFIGANKQETPKKVELPKVTLEESLFEGLKEAKSGNRIGDISHAIENHAKKYHLGVVKELVGHGIGNCVHQKPDVPNYGKRGCGMELKSGMTIAVEPMLTLGSPKVFILDDDWTIVTGDESPAAHFEHTILITDDGYEILTKR